MNTGRLRVHLTAHASFVIKHTLIAREISNAHVKAPAAAKETNHTSRFNSRVDCRGFGNQLRHQLAVS